MTDTYVSDAVNTRILQEIYHGGTATRPGGVSNDQIRLTYFNPTTNYTRTQVIQMLLQRYVSSGPSAPQSPKDYLFNINFSASACLHSLTYPAAYANASGWNAWAGGHSGHWYNDTAGTTVPPMDNATWHPAVQQTTTPSQPPYWHQPVDFLDHNTGAITRHGWNQSNSSVAYLWGWDPKGPSTPPAGGETGAHLGLRHSENDAEAIFWFTKNECFFEAVATQNNVKRRISVGLFGRGFWTIS